MPCAVHSYHNHHHYKVADPAGLEPPRTGVISPAVCGSLALPLACPVLERHWEPSGKSVVRIVWHELHQLLPCSPVSQLMEEGSLHSPPCTAAGRSSQLQFDSRPTGGSLFSTLCSVNVQPCWDCGFGWVIWAVLLWCPHGHRAVGCSPGIGGLVLVRHCQNTCLHTDPRKV